MSDATFSLTRYRGLYDTNPQETVTLGWFQVAKLLSTPIEAADKFSVPGFSASLLQPPPAPCTKHTERGVTVTKTHAHRCELCVVHVSLFIFDVDAGTQEDIGNCEQLLRNAGLAAHFYSSHSNRPDKPAFRLVIPPTRPVAPSEYAGLRAALIERFRIPCKREQSSDTSRFWFLPSHPPGVAPIFETLDGELLDVDLVEPVILPDAPRPKSPIAPVDWSPPPEPSPGVAVDLKPIREKLSAVSTRLQKSQDTRRKGLYVRRLLNGDALAEHGSRNQAAFVTCGIVAFALPNTPLSVLLVLFRPSLNAMIAAGSKLTESKLERMLLSAMRAKAERDHQTRELGKLLDERKRAGEAALVTIE
jgi:hypothetical protein